MNRLQLELQSRRVAETEEQEPEVLQLCGIEVAYPLLSMSGVERILARDNAITNARFDELQTDLDHLYTQASGSLIEVANQIGNRVEAILDRAAYAEEYGIDEDDQVEYVLAEGRHLRIKSGKFPASQYLK